MNFDRVPLKSFGYACLKSNLPRNKFKCCLLNLSRLYPSQKSNSSRMYVLFSFVKSCAIIILGVITWIPHPSFILNEDKDEETLGIWHTASTILTEGSTMKTCWFSKKAVFQYANTLFAVDIPI